MLPVKIDNISLPYTADIVCFNRTEQKVCIVEIDGKQHWEDTEQIRKDNIRMKELADQGIPTIRFQNHSARLNPDKCVACVKELIGLPIVPIVLTHEFYISSKEMLAQRRQRLTKEEDEYVKKMWAEALLNHTEKGRKMREERKAKSEPLRNLKKNRRL